MNRKGRRQEGACGFAHEPPPQRPPLLAPLASLEQAVAPGWRAWWRVLGVVLFLGATLALSAATGPERGRFQVLHVYLEGGKEPLAAYQLLLHATNGAVRIVGIEGGEAGPFQDPPFYDPKAIQQDRVILAAFSTRPKSELPTGRVRVATLHLFVTGEAPPAFEAKLRAAATHGGARIGPTVSTELVGP